MARGQARIFFAMCDFWNTFQKDLILNGMQLFFGIMELFLRMISVEIFLVLMCKIMAIIFDIAVILYIFVWIKW